jgi:hypothetical protein
LLAAFSSYGEVNGMAEFKQMKSGSFVHYMWGHTYPVKVTRSIQELKVFGRIK